MIVDSPKFDVGIAQEDLPEARVGVESGLNFNGTTQQVTAPNGYNLGGSVSIVCFFFQNDIKGGAVTSNLFALFVGAIERLSLRTNNNIATLQAGSTGVLSLSATDTFELGQWQMVCATISGGDGKIYINGKLSNSASGFAAAYDFGAGDVFIGHQLGANIVDGVISHCALFSKALTETEIQFIHQNGGIIPESAHADCVAHYPLTHRFAPLIDEFGVGQHGIIDVVEQYNYAKGNSLTTDGSSEAGTHGDFGVEFSNTIGTQFSFEVGLLDLSGSNGDHAYGTIPSLGGAGTFNFSNMEIGVFMADNVRITEVTGGIIGPVIDTTPTEGDKVEFIQNGADVDVFIRGVLKHTFTTYTMAGKFLMAQFPTVNNQILNKGTNININGAPVVGNLAATGTIYNVGPPALVANHGELINFTDAELGAVDVSTNTAFTDFYNKTSAPTNWYQATVQPLPEDNIEVHSLFPEPVKSYDMTGQTLTLAGLGTCESLVFLITNNGATFINVSDFVNVTGTFLLNGNLVSEPDLITEINSGSVSCVEIQGTFTTLTFNPDTYHLGYLGSTTAILTEKESRRICNNTLIRNPSVQLQADKWNHVWDLNADGPNDLIGAVNGVLVGVTLVDTNSLR